MSEIIENKLFETEDSANKMIKELEEGMKDKHCPAFQSWCYGSKCHSFVSGKIRTKKEDGFLIMGPFCSSPLVNGTIEHEMP